MVVDNTGGAYVGNFGFNRHAGEKPKPTTLVRVSPSGEVSIAAEDLWFPNGAVITPDSSTLIIAETRANRLTAFDILQDGKLENRRVFAETENNSKHLIQAQKLKIALGQINPGVSSNQAEPGALVVTDNGNFFIAIS